jgi:hypothetical protein
VEQLVKLKNSNLKAFLNLVFCPSNTQWLNDASSCNMGRGFNFRLLYRVVFFSFGLIFASFYHGGGLESASSEYGRREDKAEPNQFKDEFKGKPLNVNVSLEQDERVPNLTENDQQIDGRKARKKTDFSKMVRKGNV